MLKILLEILISITLLNFIWVFPCRGKELDNYSVSWIGNSFPGASKWIQQDISDIFVTEDGTVYSIIFWDEAGGEITVYKDGHVLGIAGHTHGWGYQAGSAIALNSKYLFFAQAVNNEGGHLVDAETWPPKGYSWYGVGRRKLSDIKQAAPFPEGKGGKGDTLKGGFLMVHEVPDNTKNPHISGIWATDERLYISCPYDHKVRIYNAESMEFISSWSINNPGQIWMDKEGMLWIIQSKSNKNPTRIARYSPEGELQPQNIILTEEIIPVDMCIDKQGRLLVTDTGIKQQIHIYANITHIPELVGAFGIKGGIYGGNGEFGHLRFNDPRGVGTDKSGNIYVAGSGSSARDAGGGGGSTVLESYTEDGKLNWRLFGLEFVDMADADPISRVDVYTKEEHFVMDYSKPIGQEWTYKGYTVNRFKYPDDPRTHIWSAGAWVRRIQGSLFLFVHEMNASYLQVYRFNPDTDGEVAIPSGFFTGRRIEKDGWLANQPAEGEWIWRDSNGNGFFDDDEYIKNNGKNAPPYQGWWVDSAGNVWQATENHGIRKFPIQGLDNKGNPIWNYDTMEIFPKTEEFDRLKRIRYYPETDTMYLGGTTADHKNQHWKPMGPVICRYDNWSKGNRIPRWQITAIYEKGSKGHSSCEPMTFDIAGDHIFIPYTGKSSELGFSMGHIEVYHKDTGERIGYMEPSSEIGEIGLQDIRECITAHQRPDGEYIIFLEDDWKAKILMYRWKAKD